jgi:hypothetical protein
MTVRFANNFNAALAASISSAATTISLPAGYGSLLSTKLGAPLGTDHIYGTLVNSANDIEIVKITAITGDDLTVLRGLDNTSARAWLAGDVLSLRACAASLSEAVTLPADLAHSGINLDITELRGLTTPLSVLQGGTGEGSLADLLAALGIAFPLPVVDGGTGVTSLAALTTAQGLTPGVGTLAYVAPGTSGNVLTSTGSAWASSTPTSMLTSMTAQATTSGSAVDFTIPSWAKRVTVTLKGVVGSVFSSANFIRLGDAGGVETTGYVGPSGSSTSYFDLSNTTLGVSGVVTLVKESGNTWCVSGVTTIATVSGYKTLSDTLTTVRVGSASTFSAGEVNVLYE